MASDESVYDAMSGKPLHFEVVSGAEARKDALMADAELDTEYIKVTLARPVPENGQGRVIIVKTYKDASYFVDGKAIVFKRSLGIQRDKVVLPAGCEVVKLTVPSQILTEKDGHSARDTATLAPHKITKRSVLNPGFTRARFQRVPTDRNAPITSSVDNIPETRR